MEKDILVILMVAFGLFAIVMFILFFIYLKKYYNSKHLEEDYQKEIDETPIQDDVPNVVPNEPIVVEPVTPPVVEPVQEPVVTPQVEPVKPEFEGDMEFIPIKKK